MKHGKASSVALVVWALTGVLLPSHGQTGAVTATVGAREIRFVFPLTREDSLPPPPLPPPPPPPEPLPRIVPPSIPGGLRVETWNDRELTLGWEPAQAAPGHAVVRYEILRNGTRVGETAGTVSVQGYDPAGGIVEFFSVQAVDDRGARSAPAREVMAPFAEGPGGLFFQARTVFAQRTLGGYLGLIDGDTTFLKREYFHRLHREDPASDSVIDMVESIVEVYDSGSGEVHNKSQLTWTGTGIFADYNLSIDYEGNESDADFGGVLLDIGRLEVFFDDPDKTNAYSHVEAGGSPDFSELSEIIYSSAVSEEALQASVESDFQRVRSELESLGWGQTYGISGGQPAESGGLPLAERETGRMTASDYRIGVPPGARWHVRWAELFIPAGGEAHEILTVHDELVDGTNGTAFTSPHHVAPQGRLGITTIVLINGIAAAVPAPSGGPKMFTPNAIFAGQPAHLPIAAAAFVPGAIGEPEVGTGGPGPAGPPPVGGGLFALPPPYRFDSIVLTVSDPAHAVKLFAVDPTVEAAAGWAEAVVRGREILSGTNLANLQLLNGMGYGQWRLMAVGQGSGSVELSLEYGNSPLARLTTTFVVYPTLELAVDANRDHVVTLPHENDSDVTTADTPFRFWLNDDVDRGHTVDDTDYEQDDIGPAEAAANHWPEDWTCNFIPSERDLEDFTRLSLTAEGWERSLQTGEISLGLKWAEVTGNPAIKLYPQVEGEGGTSYLTDSLEAGLQRLQPALLDERGLGDDLSLPSARTVVGSDDVFVLPADFWAENGSRRSLLFEGCRAGTGCLRPVLLRREAGSYVEIGELPGVWFDLKRIGDMYEHWSVGNGNGVAPAAAATRVPAETGEGGTFTYTADDPENREYILYVHGWNMEKWEKERFAETAYKRLYWQGYRGRFGLFSWPTTYGFDSDWDAIFDRTNFDRGEFVAWRSAAPLRQLLQDLAAAYHGELYVFSHSMGAVVASEALRLQSDARGPQVAKVYVAGQAALSAHVYDGSLGEEPGAPAALQWRYTHPRLKIPGDYGPDTPDVYRNWAAFIASGSAVSTAAVGRVVNFYNENDFALSAPVWQFDQLTKPDFADFPDWLWEYRYDGDPAAAPTSAGFRKFGKFTNITGEVTLHLGTRTDPADRYEIMAFAAESHVKALGATADVHHGISGAVDLRALWPVDDEEHKTHRWHSAEFRSSIHEQRGWWMTLLSREVFNIPSFVLR